MGVGVGAAFVLAGLVAGQAFSPTPRCRRSQRRAWWSQASRCPCKAGCGRSTESSSARGLPLSRGHLRHRSRRAGRRALVALVVGAGPAIESDMVKCALLWTVFNTVFMGVRAIANGTRARGDAWMHSAE